MKKRYSKTKVTLLAVLGRWILSFIYKTNQWDVRGADNYKSELNKKKSVIISVWHGNLLIPFMNLATNNYYGLAGTNGPEINSQGLCLSPFRTPIVFSRRSFLSRM